MDSWEATRMTCLTNLRENFSGSQWALISKLDNSMTEISSQDNNQVTRASIKDRAHLRTFLRNSWAKANQIIWSHNRVAKDKFMMFDFI